MSDPTARIWEAIGRLSRSRATYHVATVTAVNAGASTFTAQVAGAEPLAGIKAPPHFLPEVGDEVRLTLYGAIPVYEPGGIAEGAVTERELDPGVTDSIDQAITLSNGKTTVRWDTAAPTSATPGTAAGDLWYRRSGAVLIGAWEWDGDSWEPRTFGDAVLANLVADKILTGTLSAATRINVGDPAGDHTEIDGTKGLVAYASDPSDGVPNEVARFGRNSGGIDSVTGEQTWNIPENGIPSFKGGYFTDYPVIGGTRLDTLLDRFPRGDVVNFYDGRIVGSIIAEFGVAEVYFVAPPGRNYTITVGIQTSSTINDGEVTVRVRGTTDGSRPTTNSQAYAARSFTQRVGGRWNYQEFTIPFQRVTSDPSVPVKFLLTLARGDGQATGTVGTVGTVTPFIRVTDTGPILFSAGTAANDGTPAGSSVAAPSRQVYEGFASWSRTFKGDGSVRTDTTDLVQGYNSFNGIQKAMVGWGDLTAMLSGATIESVQIYLYAYHWDANSGGTALIGTHGQLSLPGSFSGTTNRLPVSGWPKLGGRWVNLTDWAAEFKSGAIRGITLGPPGDTNLLYYGRFAGAADAAHPELRPKLQIVYYK